MRRRAALTALLLAAACSAGYTQRFAPVRLALQAGGAGAALQRFDEAFTDSTGNDRLLYLVEKGNLLRLSGRPSEAIPYLLEADRLTDLLRGTDAGEEAAALLTSDLARAYRGSDYESVLINYCLATCYTELGMTEDALVECRRVSHKLVVYNDNYDQDNRYSDDAFVRYFAGMLFESAGDTENALVAYRNSLEVYESGYAEHYRMEVPDRVRMDVLRLTALPGFEDIHAGYAEMWPHLSWEGTGPSPGTGEVVLVVEEDLVPVRHSSVVQGRVDDRIVRIAVPSMHEPPRPSTRLMVRCGAAVAEGFLAEDLAAIAVANLEDQAGRDLAAALARAAVKTGLSYAAEELVEEATGEEDGCWSQGAGLLVGIAGAAAEQADLRAWLSLPARIHVARITLAPGTRMLRAELGQATVFDGPVEVREGGMTFLFASSSPGRK